MAEQPSFGQWPPAYERALAIIDPTSSEPFPDGRLVLNKGGVFAAYTRVGAGHYTLTLNVPSGVPSLDNTGIQVTAAVDSGSSEDVRIAAYSIEALTPPKLHVYVNDAAGAAADPLRVTVTLHSV